MRDYFEFDGKDSRDFGIYVADTNQFDAPVRSIESVSIPGKNGDLTLDNGRYENIEKRYTVYIRGNIQDNIRALRSHLMKSSGYRILKDTLNPDEFYEARYVSGLEVSNSDRYRAAFELVFDRKPQRFLNSGAELKIISTSTILLNPTEFNAYPMLRIYSSANESLIKVNGIQFDFRAHSIDIDCETQDAYWGGINKNGDVSGTFPVFTPGNNTITLGSGITSCEIYPRWWTI